MRFKAFAKFIFVGFLYFVHNLAQAGVVSVSNYPLALLSHAVTQGNNDAKVLLSAGDVGHHGSLSPSKVKLVQDSDFVVWFGESLEQNLVKTLQDAPNSISLLKFDAFVRLPLRNLDGAHKVDSEDIHLWLEPHNAKAIVKALAVIHSHANPQHKTTYHQNANQFIKRMNEAQELIKPSKVYPYWAYHDSYQYIERSAGLKFTGALTPDHHLAPKITQIRKLSKTRPSSQMCLVSQSHVSEGIQNKLGDVVVSVQQEDMSGMHDDFVQAWIQLVQDLQNCAKVSSGR